MKLTNAIKTQLTGQQTNNQLSQDSHSSLGQALRKNNQNVTTTKLTATQLYNHNHLLVLHLINSSIVTDIGIQSCVTSKSLTFVWKSN